MNDNTKSSATSTTASENQGGRQFFDFQATGLCYINDVRVIKPTGRGKPYLAVRCAFLQGPNDDVKKVYINCNVYGAKPKELLMPYVDNKDARIMARAKISDLNLSTYTVKSGEHVGEVRPTLYARLYDIPFLKVDGTVVHQQVREDQARATGTDDHSAPADNESSGDEEVVY